MNKFLRAIITAFLFLARFSFGADIPLPTPPAKPVLTGDWSSPVQGLRGRLILELGDKIADCDSAVVSLELQNTSDTMNPQRIYYSEDNSVLCTLLDSTSKPVAMAGGMGDVWSNYPYWLALPMGATLRFHVSYTGFAPSGSNYKPATGLLICLRGGPWIIPSDASTNYTLSATLKITPPPTDPRFPGIYAGDVWHGEIILPKLIIPAHFLPAQASSLAPIK